MTGSGWRVGKRTLVSVIVMLASVGVSTTYFGLVYLNQSPCPNGATLRSHVIISDYNGFNDSKDHPLTLNAQRNDCVFITVENRDAQTHALAVKMYAPNGVVVPVGKTESMRFYATSTGQFSIWEPIFSSIYVLDKGVLSVT